MIEARIETSARREPGAGEGKRMEWNAIGGSCNRPELVPQIITQSNPIFYWRSDCARPSQRIKIQPSREGKLFGGQCEGGF